MKLSDYVAECIAGLGIQHVFLISGGAAAHLVDSVSRHPKLTHICPQHEQQGGAAADTYARIREGMGAMITTSGPGATNLITSVCNSFFDSIPCLFISGQVATFRIRPTAALRQKGFQETDVVSIFKSVTNYAVQIREARQIRYEMEKAIYLATHGRPGPVLVDIPDDLQREDIDPSTLPRFTPPIQKKLSLKSAAQRIHDLIQKSQRPMLIYGAGVRISGAAEEAIRFARAYHLPLLLTWGGMDLLPAQDPLNMGGVGVCGPRAGNFAAQQADLVIGMGTRLSQMITGGKQELFAPLAKKVMVDIDLAELEKFSSSGLHLDVKVCAPLSDFFAAASDYTPPDTDRFVSWRKQITQWRKEYLICPPHYFEEKGSVNSYVFIHELSKHSKKGDIILTDAGGNLSWTMQGIAVKADQRVLSAWNHSPMGYSLPAAVGAALAKKRRVICIIGDGGLMMCLSELATIVRYKLPITIFVFNNHGHGIQKQTLDTWMGGRYTAVDEKTGLSFPDFCAVAKSFGIPAVTIKDHRQLKQKLGPILQHKGYQLCNVEITPNQKIIPMLKFGAGLEDLDPKLPTEELARIMNRGSSNEG